MENVKSVDQIDFYNNNKKIFFLDPDYFQLRSFNKTKENNKNKINN